MLVKNFCDFSSYLTSTVILGDFNFAKGMGFKMTEKWPKISRKS